MTLVVRAPATTANLGPGFDCAAVALDLWNEVEVAEGGEEPPDPAHIGVRAFGLVASPEGLDLRWSEVIPRARGLGSSAATIAAVGWKRVSAPQSNSTGSRPSACRALRCAG